MDNLTRFVSHGTFAMEAETYISQPWALYALSAVLAYPLLVASLRYGRIRASEAKHAYPNQESYASMTDNEAFEIINQMAELEFPAIFEKALQFALFRVRYPLPSPDPESRDLTISVPNAITDLWHSKHQLLARQDLSAVLCQYSWKTVC